MIRIFRFLIKLTVCFVVLLHPGFQEPIEASQNPNPNNADIIRELRGNVGLTELKKLAFSLEQSTELQIQDFNSDQDSPTGSIEDATQFYAAESTDKESDDGEIPRLDKFFDRFIMARLLPKITQEKPTR